MDSEKDILSQSLLVLALVTSLDYAFENDDERLVSLVILWNGDVVDVFIPFVLAAGQDFKRSLTIQKVGFFGSSLAAGQDDLHPVVYWTVEDGKVGFTFLLSVVTPALGL